MSHLPGGSSSLSQNTNPNSTPRLASSALPRDYPDFSSPVYCEADDKSLDAAKFPSPDRDREAATPSTVGAADTSESITRVAMWKVINDGLKMQLSGLNEALRHLREAGGPAGDIAMIEAMKAGLQNVVFVGQISSTSWLDLVTMGINRQPRVAPASDFHQHLLSDLEENLTYAQQAESRTDKVLEEYREWNRKLVHRPEAAFREYVAVMRWKFLHKDKQDAANEYFNGLDAIQSEGKTFLEECGENLLVSVIEVKRGERNNEQLLDHIPQVLSEAYVLSVRNKFEGQGALVPFVLTDGFKWIFGLLYRPGPRWEYFRTEPLTIVRNSLESPSAEFEMRAAMRMVLELLVELMCGDRLHMLNVLESLPHEMMDPLQ
ncbi:hypothetical protein FRB90_012506 [Tulasnella sp. 427]|nr:hypothetical protein FRB90_012506 [Tulasnella sp. 427]